VYLVWLSSGVLRFHAAAACTTGCERPVAPADAEQSEMAGRCAQAAEQATRSGQSPYTQHRQVCVVDIPSELDSAALPASKHEHVLACAMGVLA
jgi:hypothetical protein